MFANDKSCLPGSFIPADDVVYNNKFCVCSTLVNSPLVSQQLIFILYQFFLSLSYGSSRANVGDDEASRIVLIEKKGNLE